MHRVDRLADRKNDSGKGFPAFHSIIPLPEIISEVVKVGVNSKRVNNEYMNVLESLGNEFRILMDTPPGDIEETAGPVLMEAILKMRTGDIYIAPGYDGEFGKIRIFG